MSRLTENLKRLEEMGKLNRYHMGIIEGSLKEYEEEIRAKAIEEFAEQFCAACCENTFHATINGIKNVEMMTLDGVTETIFEVAEKMKGGAT